MEKITIDLPYFDTIEAMKKLSPKEIMSNQIVEDRFREEIYRLRLINYLNERRIVFKEIT